MSAGGERIGNRGYYFPLTVLADVPDDARAMREEPFGPLALLTPCAASTRRSKGQFRAVWPRRLCLYQLGAECRPVAEGVEVGNLSINHFVASSAETPFGGVKDSGFGREGGIEGLQCYTVVKNVSHLTA